MGVRLLSAVICVGLMIPIGLLVAGAASAAEPSPDAAQIATFVQNLYSGKPWTAQKKYFDPPMVALIEEDRRLTPKGEMGALDFDPFCDCQDAEGLRTQVVVRTVTQSEATVEANLTFGGDGANQKVKVTYHLVKIAGAWRIHDISSKDAPSLRQLFITSNAQARGHH